uniref:Immunoglobulin subtype domain-containing protein n=1 Tax=Sinocyclocheilus anshuiensis TaxID=1608454 RepID=A0A671R1A3_9TELE
EHLNNLCKIFLYSPGVFGDLVSVMEGDSVTLKTNIEVCDGDDILWKYGAGKSLIAKMKKKKHIVSTYNVTDERFRDRLKLDKQTGSATITNITTQLAGVYQLEIAGANLTFKTFNVSCKIPNIHSINHAFSLFSQCSAACLVSDLSISLSLPLETQHLDISKLCHTSPVSLILLISAAGSLLILVAVGIFCICRKYRKTDQEGKRSLLLLRKHWK